MSEPLFPKSCRHPARRGDLRSTGRTLWSALTGILLVGAVLGLPAPAFADTESSTVTRMVVRFHPGSVPDLTGSRATAQSAGQARSAAESLRQKLSSRAGRALSVVRQMSDGAVIYDTGSALTLTEARAMAARLSQDASVLDADPDLHVTSHESVVYNDPYYSQQWNFKGAGSVTGGAGFASAHLNALGTGVVVAVLDTGATAHPDLTSNVLPGYDLVTASTSVWTGDGDGRDGDPTDTGDACSASNNSSWHGLKVSGVIAAVPNNKLGVAGAAPGVSLLPVRVMGKCGGNLSDVADGILWAVGALSPTHSHPARVINLSLGATGYSCPAYLQSAIHTARARGAVVVASAGNDAKGELATPANCAGVISVGAHTPSGDMADYSNRSGAMGLTAPAGGTCLRQESGVCSTSSVLTLTQSGQTSYFSGTSAAAPHVSAAAALMLSLNPTLTPDQIRSALLAHARPHPSSSWCALNSGQCGSGMLDAEASALAVVSGPQIWVSGAPASAIGSGRQVALNASVAGLAPFTYRWTQTAGTAVATTGANGASLSFVSPSVRSELSFILTVTDAANREQKAVVPVSVNNAPMLSGQTYTQTGQAAIQIALGGTEPDGDALTHVLVDGPASASIVGGTLYWPSPQGGTTTFQVQALDPQGLGSAVVDVTVNVEGVSVSMSTGGDSVSANAAGTSSATSSTSSNSGGGGGSLTGWPLAALSLALLALRHAQRKRSSSLREALSSVRRSGTL